MKPSVNAPPLLIWSAREIMRHPGRKLLVFACMTSLVFLVATALLLSQALEATWDRHMQHAPDLVIRRIDAGGWTPMPADMAATLAKTVPGVLNPTPRLWGTAAGPQGPLTVVASTGVIPQEVLQGITPPSSGQVVVGRGVADGLTGNRLVLNGRTDMTVTVIATFPEASDLATNDLVWMAPADARQLLGLAPDQVSDLAIYLFREEEEQVIQADLAAAFPWPVHITGRSTSAWRHHTRAVRMGGIAVVACIPAVLALLLIITATIAGSNGRQAHWGLLKSLGWTTRDIVRLQTTTAAMVGLPAVIAGLAAAYAVVFYPPTAGIAALWVTGSRHLPSLVLSRPGAVVTMLEIAALVGLPYLAAVFLTTLKGAANDPWHLLQADPWN